MDIVKQKANLFESKPIPEINVLSPIQECKDKKLTSSVPDSIRSKPVSDVFKTGFKEAKRSPLDVPNQDSCVQDKLSVSRATISAHQEESQIELHVPDARRLLQEVNVSQGQAEVTSVKSHKTAPQVEIDISPSKSQIEVSQNIDSDSSR